jgi:hypothetical protein
MNFPTQNSKMNEKHDILNRIKETNDNHKENGLDPLTKMALVMALICIIGIIIVICLFI